MNNVVVRNSGRREFLRAAPLAAAAGITLANSFLAPVMSGQAATARGAPDAGSASATDGGLSFQVFTAQEIQNDVKVLVASPGNNNLVQGKNFTVVLTVETAKTGAEYEWHEGRDHVFQILDGETVYEVGGTAKGAHNIGPGEWRAPEAEGTMKFTLRKGDMLTVPRGTLHRRSTAGTVTFTLISPQGIVSARSSA